MEDKPFNIFSFNQFLNEEKLMGCRCRKCGALFLPPRAICFKCNAKEMDWVQMKERGKLLTFTSINVGFPWMVAQGYDRTHPYCSGVVELEEGVRIVARIEGVDATKPEAIKISMPVVVGFLHSGESDGLKTTLAFKRA